MKNTILIVLLFIFKQQTIAQTNFVSGIIVTSTGDSLTGKIDYRDWKKTPERIRFENSSGQIQTFDASGIRSFYIVPENDTYISQSVEIDMTPDDPDKVLAANTTIPSVIEKTIFMLQLVRNPLLSLYGFVDNNNKNHFYYVKQNEKPVELIHHYLYVEQD